MTHTSPKDVERFTPSREFTDHLFTCLISSPALMLKDRKGDYVRYSEYAALSAQLEACRDAHAEQDRYLYEAEARHATSHAAGKAEGLREAYAIAESKAGFTRDELKSASAAEIMNTLVSVTKARTLHNLADELLALIPADTPDTPTAKVTVQEAATIAECAFDDRPLSRAGHHSEMDWTDGYRDGTRAAAAALRAIAGGRDV